MRLIERGEDTSGRKTTKAVIKQETQELKTKVLTTGNRYKKKSKDGINRA